MLPNDLPARRDFVSNGSLAKIQLIDVSQDLQLKVGFFFLLQVNIFRNMYLLLTAATQMKLYDTILLAILRCCWKSWSNTKDQQQRKQPTNRLVKNHSLHFTPAKITSK